MAKLVDGERKDGRQDREPDVEGELGEAEQDQHVAHVDGIAPVAERAVGDEPVGALVGPHRGARAVEGDEGPGHERNAGGTQAVPDDARGQIVEPGPRQGIEPAREPADRQHGEDQHRGPGNFGRFRRARRLHWRAAPVAAELRLMICAHPLRKALPAGHPRERACRGVVRALARMLLQGDTP